MDSNWIAGDVEMIAPREENLKIPRMAGTRSISSASIQCSSALSLGRKGRHAYFVHSYHLNAANEADVLARADSASR